MLICKKGPKGKEIDRYLKRIKMRIYCKIDNNVNTVNTEPKLEI